MNNKKSIVVIALLIAILSMSFSVATYSVSNNKVKEWDVSITDVEVITNGEVIEGNTKYSEGTLVLNPIFNTSLDSIIYRVIISNNGSIDAVLKRSIYNEEDKNSSIKYRIEEPKKIIKSGEKIEIYIEAKVDRNKYKEGDKTNKLTALYEYIQK